MDTISWGPHAWRLLHSISFAYPTKPSEIERRRTKEFFTSLQHVLPCPDCRHHFARLLREKPIDDALTSQDLFCRWLVGAHNDVNERLGKPHMPFESVKTKYESLRGICQLPQTGSTLTDASGKKSSCNRNLMWMVILLVVLLAVVAIAALIVKRRK